MEKVDGRVDTQQELSSYVHPNVKDEDQADTTHMTIASGAATPVQHRPYIPYYLCWRNTAMLLYTRIQLEQDVEEVDYSTPSLDHHSSSGNLSIEQSIKMRTLSSVRPLHILKQSEPLRIRGDLSKFFEGDWNIDALCQEFHSHHFNILLRIGSTLEFAMTLKDFVHYMRNNSDSQPLYLFEAHLPETLSARVHVPPFFEENFLTELDDPAFTSRQWLLIGGENSGLSFHQDPFGCCAWNALLKGRKRWAFYPPGQKPPGTQFRQGDKDTIEYDSVSSLSWFKEVLPTLSGDDKPIEAVQEAGDIIYIPSGWWHCVINLTESVAYTQNVINRGNVKVAASQLKTFEPRFSNRLRCPYWISRVSHLVVVYRAVFCFGHARPARVCFFKKIIIIFLIFTPQGFDVVTSPGMSANLIAIILINYRHFFFWHMNWEETNRCVNANSFVQQIFLLYLFVVLISGGLYINNGIRCSHQLLRVAFMVPPSVAYCAPTFSYKPPI